MTEDITSLQIRILYDSVTEAERRLVRLETTGEKARRGMDKTAKSSSLLNNNVARLALSYISLHSAISLVRGIIRTTSEFQVLNAQLVTATGSADKAALAFQAIKDFAQQTPYDLQQATGAFISLVNRGLTPSERALRSYGDTASSMGFELAEMVLAVSNATAGEFETLKRFGIRAMKEGDNVKFTFRGVTTTVKNNIDEIENYFIKLGENDFSGGMARQMDTLKGKFSNLGDAWEVLQNTIGENGIGDAVEGGVDRAIAAIEELNSMIESGELAKNLEAFGYKFEGIFEDIEYGADSAREAFELMFLGIRVLMGDHETDVQDKVLDPWEEFGTFVDELPQRFSYMTKLLAAEIEMLTVKFGIMAGQAKKSTIKPLQDMFQDLGEMSGYAFGSNSFKTNPLGLTGGAFGATNMDLANPTNVAGQRRLREMPEENRQSEIDSLMLQYAEFDWEKKAEQADDYFADALLGSRELNDEAARLRSEYDSKAAERAKNKEDRLAGFRVGGGGGDTGGGSSSGGRAKRGGKGSSEFQTLEKSLRDQETLISESYQRRFALIEANTRQGSAYQAELEISLTDQFQEEQQRRLDLMKQNPETMFQAFAEEERMIQESYDRRRDIILEATELTESEKLRMLSEAQTQYTEQIRKNETDRNKITLDLASDFFGNMSQIAGAFGKRGAKIAKAAAIAQTTIKTYESATSAYASLAFIPYVGPVLGAAAAGAAIAAGFANIQAIRATDDSGGYAGAYAIGGLIPSGQFGMVGEAGPELVQGPALVTSARSTADRYGNGGGGKPVQINIINQAGGVEVEQTGQRETREGLIVEMIVKKAVDRTKSELTGEIRTGGSAFARTVQDTFKLSRAK